MMKIIKIGSRESKLAVVQSEFVKDSIQKFNKNYSVELVTMKTTGDIILDRKLDEVGGKGLFTKELDIALMEGRTDISVHSLKDMPAVIPGELPLIAFSKREDPRDVLILPLGEKEFDITKPIGCSSQRRTIQLKNIYPGAEIKNVRGNVLTRLRKLDEGEYGALILAAAGIKRLGLENRINRYFNTEEIIPAAGQGIIVVQGKIGNEYEYLATYNNKESEYCAKAERAFVRALEGSCSSPIGAYAIVKHDTICLTGLFYNEVNHSCIVDSLEGDINNAIQIGETLAKKIKEAGRIDNGER